MANSINKIKIKNQDSYNIEDINAIKSIKYGSGSSYTEYTPDSNGCVKLQKTVISTASPTVIGGVKISKNTNYTNIDISTDGILSAIVPIKTIVDNDGISIQPDDDNEITLPMSSSTKYGLVKISNEHHIDIESDTGIIFPVFGNSEETFSNIDIEPDEIDFSQLYDTGVFNLE